MKNTWSFIILSLALLLTTHKGKSQFYNGLNMKFGKNRVQYDERFWFYYQMDKYNIYHYAGGENVAEYTALTAHKTMKELEKSLDFFNNEKIYFVIYNKLSEFRQSNIGLNEDDGSNTGGVTRISGSKIFLYFEGDYVKLNHQIKSGLSEIMINKLMFGENWKEVIKNSALLTIPDWYVQGLVSHLTYGWSADVNNKVKDAIMNERFNKFNRLSPQETNYAGHALWNFIEEVHGAKVIPNILYMSRVSRSIESGFLFVLGITLNTVIEESILHYKVKYEFEQEKTIEPQGEAAKIRSKNRWTYADWKLSPDGNKAVYSRNRLGKYKVFLYDFETNKKKKIYKQGFKLDRINDYSYPHIDWHPNGEIVSIITELKAANYFNQYFLEEKKLYTQPIFQIELILDYAYSPDGNNLVISGIKSGQSDIYLLNIASKTQKQLTNDIFDDKHPKFVNNNEIIFASNRTSDTLSNKERQKISALNSPNSNIFLLNTKNSKAPLTRITNSPFDIDIQPAYFKDGQYAYLSDQNGIFNRYLAELDSSIIAIDTSIRYEYFTKSKPISNYQRNILEQDIQIGSETYGELIYQNGKFKFLKGNLLNDIRLAEEADFENKKKETFPIVDTNQNQDQPLEDNKIKYTTINVFENYDDDASNEANNFIDINNYRFDDEREVEPKRPEKKEQFIQIKEKISPTPSSNDSVYLPQRRNYNLNFTGVDLTTALDFDYATDIYQPFNGGPWINPGMGALLKVGMEDLFEDYLLESGGRLGLDGGSNEFFLALENRSRRLDKKYILQRQVLSNIPDVLTFANRSVIHQGKVILGYPINEVLGIQTSLLFRNDEIIDLAIDNTSLSTPSTFRNWGGFKTTLVFDNTRDVMLNIKYGTRLKLFYEIYNEFGEGNGDISIAGFDFRHYQEIHKEIIFAVRAAGSTSFGGRKLVYYMGAVDNWFTLSERDRFDFSTPIAQDQNYFWQAIATNMRGFVQNARNGNSFAVINHELRWPVIKYFARKPLKNEFFGNLILVGFGDIGTAWTGNSPFSEENAFNTIEIPGNPITIRLDNKRNPIVGAYGFGLRSKLFGYYIRLDYGWGVEDQIIQTPLLQLSMSLDF